MHISGRSDLVLVQAKANSFDLSLPKGLEQSYYKGDVGMGLFHNSSIHNFLHLILIQIKLHRPEGLKQLQTKEP